MATYTIFYDYDDEEGNTYRNCQETFCGSWTELQDYIARMKQGDCYNIDVGSYDDEY